MFANCVQGLSPRMLGQMLQATPVLERYCNTLLLKTVQYPIFLPSVVPVPNWPIAWPPVLLHTASSQTLIETN